MSLQMKKRKENPTWLVKRQAQRDSEMPPGIPWLGGKWLRGPESAGAAGAKIQGYEGQVLNFPWGLRPNRAAPLSTSLLEQRVAWVPLGRPLLPWASRLSPERPRPRTEGLGEEGRRRQQNKGIPSDVSGMAHWVPSLGKRGLRAQVARRGEKWAWGSGRGESCSDSGRGPGGPLMPARDLADPPGSSGGSCCCLWRQERVPPYLGRLQRPSPPAWSPAPRQPPTPQPHRAPAYLRPRHTQKPPSPPPHLDPACAPASLRLAPIPPPRPHPPASPPSCPGLPAPRGPSCFPAGTRRLGELQCTASPCALKYPRCPHGRPTQACRSPPVCTLPLMTPQAQEPRRGGAQSPERLHLAGPSVCNWVVCPGLQEVRAHRCPQQ